MARHKNVLWVLPDQARNIADANLSVMMDIRDELQQLNKTLGCYRLGRMSDTIERIERRIAKNAPLPKGRFK